MKRPASADASAAAMLSAPAATPPSALTAFRSGSMRFMRPDASDAKPLNTESTHTVARVATATPATDTMLMILTALWLLREKRYRSAMRRLECDDGDVGGDKTVGQSPDASPEAVSASVLSRWSIFSI